MQSIYFHVLNICLVCRLLTLQAQGKTLRSGNNQHVKMVENNEDLSVEISKVKQELSEWF
jgi:hypothetical protein